LAHRKINALIFDFDGLILETEEPVYLSWQELYQAHNCTLSFDDWATIIGSADAAFNPLDELDRQLGGSLDREQTETRRRQREMDLVLERPILPGVKDYLDSAKQRGLRISLASSSPCSWVTGHLSRLGLSAYFDCVLAREDVPHSKPDPALYLSALECLQVPAGSAIAFEDSPNGILAAKRAGLFCVAVPNAMTRHLPVDHADLRLESLADLTLEALLEQVGNSAWATP